MSVIWNVKDHGVPSGSEEIVSPLVQKLIDKLAEEGGGSILFPAGEYVLATVFLRSNIHIVLEEGATIL